MRFTVATLFLTTSLTRGAVQIDQNGYFTTYQPGGMQSGPDPYGSTFAASVTYSAADNSVLMTGSTWGRYFETKEQLLDEDYDSFGNKIENPMIVQGCFLANAALPGATSQQAHSYEGNSVAVGNLFWDRRQRIRSPSANEACNAIQLFSDTASVLIAGHSEERLNATINNEVMVSETKQLGLLLDMDWNINGDRSFQLVGGQELQDNNTMYPVAMASRTNSEADGLIVIFMEADNEAKHINVKEGEQPRDPSTYFDYGAGFGFSVAMYSFTKSQVTANYAATKIAMSWSQRYDTKELKGQVYVNDVLQVASGLIVVVGTTNGQGPGFGSETDQGKDLDGFLTKISPSTGQLIIEPGFPSSYRIQSINKKHGHDWVAGICNSAANDPKYVYVVGTTEGKMSNSTDKVKGTSAFLMKFDLRKMQPIWTKQLSTETQRRKYSHVARGMACAVTPDGSSVWIGGTVDRGNYMPNSGLSKSLGGRDIFVAKLSTSTGEIQMVKQLGTNDDDELAMRGGLVTDAVGNAVLVGNTYGSMYRVRSPEETNSDVFVMTIGLFDGAIAPLPAGALTKSTSWLASVGSFILWSSLFGFFLFVLFYVYRRHASKRNKETPRSQITSYLAGFDIEDVELKHSATGGWHCNFINKLASGKFIPRRPASSARPGVIAQKSNELLDTFRRGSDLGSEHEMLFGNADPMDESNRSSNSLLFGGDQGSGYSDMIEALNNSWEPPSPRSIRQSMRGQHGSLDSENLSPAWGKEII
jgi:hypothetical protein